MIISMDKTIGTVCHMCGYAASGDISPFHIMDDFELRCNLCGAKIIHIKKQRARKSYNFKQKCFLCGETHTGNISHKAMWSKKLFSFGCDASLYDMCYIGEGEDVKKSLHELMDSLNKIAGEDSGESYAVKDSCILTAFELIKTFLATGKIRCSCNDERFIVRMTRSGIEISCGNCGAVCEINCRTAEDVENFKKTEILLLRKD